jgi:DNA replication protein DnaC
MTASVSTTTTLRRRRGLTEEAATAAVDTACRRLRLPTIRAVVEEAVAAATKDQLTYSGFLAELLLAEVDDRDRRSTARRVKIAGFPREKYLEDFDHDANPNINPALVHTLAAGDWIRRGEPLCLIGDSGTGKSHLLIALGTAAAMKGYRVKYTLATRLVNELVEAADDKTLTKTINRYGRVDLLIIDELGYMSLDTPRRRAPLPGPDRTRREEQHRDRLQRVVRRVDQDPSPTPACAPRSSTASPTAAPSSKPAPAATASTTRALLADLKDRSLSGHDRTSWPDRGAGRRARRRCRRTARPGHYRGLGGHSDRTLPQPVPQASSWAAGSCSHGPTDRSRSKRTTRPTRSCPSSWQAPSPTRTEAPTIKSCGSPTTAVATPGNATESTSHQATTWVSLPSSASRDSRLSTFRGVGPNQAVTLGPARARCLI